MNTQKEIKLNSSHGGGGRRQTNKTHLPDLQVMHPFSTAASPANICQHTTTAGHTTVRI